MGRGCGIFNSNQDPNRLRRLPPGQRILFRTAMLSCGKSLTRLWEGSTNNNTDWSKTGHGGDKGNIQPWMVKENN